MVGSVARRARFWLLKGEPDVRTALINLTAIDPKLKRGLE